MIAINSNNQEKSGGGLDDLLLLRHEKQPLKIREALYKVRERITAERTFNKIFDRCKSSLWCFDNEMTRAWCNVK